MGRNVNELLRQYCVSSCNVYSMIKPNAKFSQVIESISSMCSDFTFSDAIVIIAGTNDYSSWIPGENKSFNLSQLKPLIGKTNIIINSVPARFDKAFSNSAFNIYNSNFDLYDLASKHGFLYFDSFSFLKRHYFTRHGLHLNMHGKCEFVMKLKHFILENISEALKSHDSSTTRAIQSTSDVIHTPSTPPPGRTTLFLMDSSRDSDDSDLFHSPSGQQDDTLNETTNFTGTLKNQLFRK